MQKRTTGLTLTLAALALTISPAPAAADDARVLQLEQALQQRDQVILELLNRVEALERRVGLSRPATDRDRARATPESLPSATAEAAQPQNSTAAPGRILVDANAAERALERALTQEGLLLLPAGALEVEPRLSYARAETSVPALVRADNQLFAGSLARNVDSYTASLALRLGLPWATQLELGMPYRWREVESVTGIGFVPSSSSTDHGAGAGDLRLGLARTLMREGRWRPDLVGRLTWDTDTGEVRDGNIALGGGFHELQASLTAIKRQDPIAFVAGLSYEHAFARDHIQPGATLAASFGGFIALSPESSLQLALAGAFQRETEVAGQSIDGSDRTIATLIVGGSTLLAPGTLANLQVGIGLTEDADDLSVSLSLPVRTDGWLY